MRPRINSSQQVTQEAHYLQPSVTHLHTNHVLLLCFSLAIALEAEGLKPSVPRSRVHAQLGGCITVAPGWVFPPYQPGSGGGRQQREEADGN